MQLDVFSVDRRVYSAEVDSVVLPGSDGSLGVLPGHAPLLASLRPGIVIAQAGTVRVAIEVGPGTAEVVPDRLSLYVDDARPVPTA